MIAMLLLAVLLALTVLVCSALWLIILLKRKATGTIKEQSQGPAESAPPEKKSEGQPNLMLSKHGYEQTLNRLGSVERLRDLLQNGVRACLHPQTNALTLIIDNVVLLADDKGIGAACVVSDTNQIITVRPADHEELEVAEKSPVISIVGKVLTPSEFKSEARKIQAGLAVVFIVLFLLLSSLPDEASVLLIAIGVPAFIVAYVVMIRWGHKAILGPSLRTQLFTQGLASSPW